MNSLTQDREPAHAAPSSRWGRATSDAGEDAREALSELAASYYYCVYAWWRRAGHEAESAAVATLASFGRWLGEAPPRRSDSGSETMRTWLTQRLVELSGETLEAPAAPPIAFDPQWAETHYADEPPGEADAIFQRRWALTVLEFTVATMSAEYSARGEEALFPELVPFAGFDSGEEDRYAAAATRIGRTVGAMHKEVFDFRHRQRELLLYFAGDTLLNPAEAQSEITALLCACDAPGPEAANARLPTAIGAIHPDEMLARAMQSVRMTGGGADGWQPPTVAEAARLFPQYEVTALLGRGGMGAVYQGRQVELDRLVAIKLLPLEVSVNRDFADRFRREARAMAKLQHPNIIDVYDFGTTSEGHLYFVMEYVDGANLDAMIRGPGLEPAQALEIIGSVCDALAYAHAEGVVHRDIKPANVMVSTKGKVKVADFGLARLTDSGPEQLGHTVTGTVMGTPDYMAPEQKRGMAVDHRADIYSLGVMLYEMLCREVPQGIFDPPSQRVAVDSRVDQVVIKAMQQQPDRRYQSTQEMKTAVTEASVPQPLAIAPRRGALARLPLGGMSRAMTMFAPGAAPRSKKKPYFASLGFLAIGAAALFYLQPWKKSAPPSPSPAPQVAAPPTGPGNPGVLTKTAAFGPWQPLFTDAEWKESKSRKQIVDGRVHLENQFMLKPQPAADGAIRARISIPEASQKHAAIIARNAKGMGSYKLQAQATVQAGGTAVVLLYFPSDLKGIELERKYLSKSPPPSGLVLELRLLGNRLSALVDDTLLFEVRDSRLSEPGEWGLMASDGWFESVEVQTPLPAAAPVVNPFGPWQPLFTEAEWKETVPGRREVIDGRLHLVSRTSRKPLSAADGAIRARMQFREGNDDTSLLARAASGDSKYKLRVHQNTATLFCFPPDGGTAINLGEHRLSKPLQAGDTLLVELRLQGDRLTALLDDAVVIEARDSRITAPGQWGVLANNGWFESVEVQTPLPATADGWEDVFSKLTPEIVAQTGHGWTLKDGVLFSPDTQFATLPLPAKVSGTSYQVLVKLRQLPAKGVFYVTLPVADRMCGFELEGRIQGGIYTGLSLVNGKNGKDLPEVLERKQVNDSAPHELEVTVRLDGANATITTTLDTRPLYAWTGPTAALSQHQVWATTEPGALAFGTKAADWAVSEVKLKRLGPGAATKD
ncbi:MAG: serine/threonine-protein kinase [Chthoniobacteraceae bacterium]